MVKILHNWDDGQAALRILKEEQCFEMDFVSFLFVPTYIIVFFEILSKRYYGFLVFISL